MKLVLISLLAVVLGLGISVSLMFVNYSNSEIRLRNQISATQKSNEAVFDTTWKIVKQQCSIADKYKDSFKEIYGSIMSERYSKGDGSLMKWITESNPQFDIRLYEKVSNSIEAQRLTFLVAQKQLIDLKREHDNMRTVFPGSLFLSGRPEIKISIVTSGKTDDAFKSGKEDDVTL